MAKTPRRGYFKTWALKEGVLPTDHANGPFHELDLEELWKGVSILPIANCMPIGCHDSPMLLIDIAQLERSLMDKHTACVTMP